MKNNDFHNKDLEKLWGNEFTELPQEHINDSWSRLQHKIQKPAKTTAYSSFYVAAAAISLLLLGYFFLELQQNEIIIGNHTAQIKELQLPDGSRVLLKENSEIRYDKDFKDRLIHLQGEAFFDVVKDSLRVFEVRTSNIQARVLGTSFNINQEEKLEIANVSLYTGRLLLSIPGREKFWAIVPGERFYYHKGKVSIEPFESILSFDYGNKVIDVNGMPFGKVIDFLENSYNYSFELDDSLRDKEVTLRIGKDDSIDQILDVLAKINNTKYEIDEANKKIIITEKKKESATIK